jgi:hypothetical protein
LIELGYRDVAADSLALDKLVADAKAVADKKKTISDHDLEVSSFVGKVGWDGAC